MDLRSGYPYWFVKNGLVNSYPSLKSDIHCDVAVIGGGITGAICAYYLQRAGAKIALVDRRHIGLGSTCASTALLQYEIDTPLLKLIEKSGEENAIKSYLLCLNSIDELKKIADKLPINCDFEYKQSIYLASLKKDVKDFEQEYLLRKNIGIKIKLLSGAEIKKLTGLSAPVALLSEKGAQMDGYLFTHGLYQYLNKKGCKIFDMTQVNEIKESARSVKLICANGKTISCKKFVFANGYESQLYLKNKVAQLHSTYAIISKPLDRKHLLKLNYLIWESARPYLYMRLTKENRIITGGKDEMFYSPGKRDKLIYKKSLQLKKTFLKKYPGIPFEIDFAWAGTFAETKDGLPYIGTSKEYKHAYFALGFGGNGITFSQVAGEIISELYLTGKSHHAHLFSFLRKIKM
ncbi:MAG TPA: FAD-dependent oxidoreductase [Bacteroidia bacterium]|nr:FAD-dependent oxidoreductase [Bacteroidia bacterium]